MRLHVAYISFPLSFSSVAERCRQKSKNAYQKCGLKIIPTRFSGEPQ